MRTETKVLVFEVGMALFGLIAVLSGRRLQRQYDEIPGPEAFSLRQTISGAISAVVLSYTDDHDIGGIRRSRTRQLLFAIGWNLLVRKLDPEFEWSFGFGSVLGTLLYRVWFGIVRPIPEPRLNYRGFLRRRS
ncbi:hypothetical protein [Halalkalicoccus tibetensis]|uniref:DUF8097 domain-containing protein n=1 Tax=Halalkalicoccus tibetensis TaxID=175632 RepID=A0ABD5UYQ8_9EURY